MDLDGGAGNNKRVFNRLGTDTSKNQKVCFHWRAGKCTRFPCSFLHTEPSHPSGSAAASSTANGSGAPKRFADDSGFSGSAQRRGPNFKNNHNNSWGRMGANNKVVRKTEKVCNYWVQGNCTFGDKCRFLHSWSLGEGFSMLNHLDGHQKLLSGIVLPAGMDKLFTGSKDETLRAWDANSGQCTGVINLGGEVGCMISEGLWLFVGIPNAVKAWNTQTNQEFSLSGPAGQVYAMIVGNSLLFAGTQVIIRIVVFGLVLFISFGISCCSMCRVSHLQSSVFCRKVYWLGNLMPSPIALNQQHHSKVIPFLLYH